MRHQGGKWLSAKNMAEDLKWSPVRIRAVQKRCLQDALWKFDRYEAVLLLITLQLLKCCVFVMWQLKCATLCQLQD